MLKRGLSVEQRERERERDSIFPKISLTLGRQGSRVN